jgi:hypothetical protein
MSADSLPTGEAARETAAPSAGTGGKRCVLCGYPKALHPRPECVRFGTMDLPQGYTCSDCAHVRFCLQFLGKDIAGNTSCDWFPIRFVLPIPVPKPVPANGAEGAPAASPAGKC